MGVCARCATAEDETNKDGLINTTQPAKLPDPEPRPGPRAAGEREFDEAAAPSVGG